MVDRAWRLRDPALKHRAETPGALSWRSIPSQTIRSGWRSISGNPPGVSARGFNLGNHAGDWRLTTNAYSRFS